MSGLDTALLAVIALCGATGVTLYSWDLRRKARERRWRFAVGQHQREHMRLRSECLTRKRGKSIG